ncbi:MAG: hypothetical protein A3I13_02015 [Gammaproteobacteria bacterium RIFCSPLOWO2_02_FULL_47_50]|nr:MAG: hypothetical protein A3I13_02015 [Gammaproteobacteria bacterium RIFCSPLOWO2_02_FULL_47_50]OGT84132.1 MAG: hypothetical protein A3G42_00780 [Gammaproteobacteria bacterium RIFCSPLOWO2_12_FULL_47_76]
MALAKIISGGQTGVDRGALDAALAQNFPCGGWCPPGRMAEDGPIDHIYTMSEMDHGSYGERTRQNVIDSDGTVIFCFGELEGGTKVTLQQCIQLKKPYELINVQENSETHAAELITHFIESFSINTLNVAGPRQSKVPKAHDYTYMVISLVLETTRIKGDRYF